ncbi:hypothetical protein D893_01177 [Thioalkalivibrio sp. ALE21]|uniref:hypothetical protein n=1 Tax=Thioalkalivibrio sp. ALE21 TaxID=1158175 RepID=UPI000D85726C|nr:hypothetical protein [Thioalkalivibrio sp. ALE21]PYG03312.1 hypothetical protein D893_01177 [Thioalkalivibrio sp. ALE21]
MIYGYLILIGVMAVILLAPAVIIAFSRQVRRWRKFKWIVLALLPIVLVPNVGIFLAALIFQGRPEGALMAQGPVMLAWYLSPWVVLIVFFLMPDSGREL